MEWKVNIVEDPIMLERSVYIYRKLDGKISQYFGDGTIKTFGEGSAVAEPSMILSQQMLQGFADALDKQGISPKKQYLEGKLEATEGHMKDLRTLLKLK